MAKQPLRSYCFCWTAIAFAYDKEGSSSLPSELNQTFRSINGLPLPLQITGIIPAFFPS